MASVEPFSGPANWGGTGLMETPTARVLEENKFRAGASQVDPYRYYYIAVSPFKNLEIVGTFTEVIGVAGFKDHPEYGNYKDKSLDVKYKFIEEGKYSPAVSIGINDPTGTRVYPSQYIVASKQIYPFDFTLGLGNGRFGKSPLPAQGEGFKVEMFQDIRGWFKDSQFFWGIQFAPSEKFALMMEYSPIKYEVQTRDPAQSKYFNEPVKSNFNYGLRLKPYKWAGIDLSYQRGNQLGVNLSVAFDIGQPLIPIYDHPYREKQGDKASTLHKRLAKALDESGFSNIGIDEQGDDLWIEAQNDRYYFSTRAIGVILKIVNDIVPLNIQKVNIALTDNLIPIFRFATTRLDITELYEDKITVNEFYRLSKIDSDVLIVSDVKKEKRKYFEYGINPAFRMFLNDPSGFFKYRLGGAIWGSFSPWKGGSFVLGFEGYPINTVSTSNMPSSEPVRTDITPYQQKTLSLYRMLYKHIYKTEHNIYGKLAVGILEAEYAGFDGEVAMPLDGGRVLVGVSSSIVKKRDVDNAFRLSSQYPNTYYTAFLNTRLNMPEIETSIDVKAGRFLAGDKGARVTVSKFIKGVILSAWYSWTDTSIFKDNINKGYSDKGFMLTFPLRLFKGSDSKTTFNYAISPWTRDVAQDIEHHHDTLFDFFGRNINIYLDKDKSMIYK
ncbi:MAG: YjbH domain-containing protein [Proteobacteria bacterium]|nr:YjbH domain-containing protein [Pseudomonadota bacterium]